MAKNYVDDYGVIIRFDMGASISAATSKSINVKKPDGSTTTWSPDIYQTNFLEYQTVSGDLDQTGTWTVQPQISIGDFVGQGESATFTIYDDYE